MSTIYLEVGLAVLELQKLLNKQLPELMYEQGTPTDNLYIRATRVGEVSFRVVEKAIEITVELHLQAKMKRIMASADAEGIVLFTFSIKYEITSAFELQTQTGISEYTWKQKPRVDVGLFDFSAESILDNVLDKNKNTICNGIDKAIQDQVDLPALLKKSLKQLESPFTLSPDYPFWLLATPHQLALSIPSQKTGQVSCQLRLGTSLQLSLGATPKETTPIDFSAFQWIIKKEASSDIKIPILLPWADLEKMANKYLLQLDSITVLRQEIKIQKIRLSGNGKEVLGEVELDGPWKGTLYLSGIPHFSKEEENLKLDEINVRVETDSKVASWATTLFKKIITQKLDQQLQFSVQPFLKTYGKGKYPLVGKIGVNYVIENVVLEDIQPMDSHLSFCAGIVGNIKLGSGK